LKASIRTTQLVRDQIRHSGAVRPATSSPANTFAVTFATPLRGRHQAAQSILSRKRPPATTVEGRYEHSLFDRHVKDHAKLRIAVSRIIPAICRK
jgi:hypothetical protein